MRPSEIQDMYTLKTGWVVSCFSYTYKFNIFLQNIHLGLLTSKLLIWHFTETWSFAYFVMICLINNIHV